jgi:hypothetical protein
VLGNLVDLIDSDYLRAADGQRLDHQLTAIIEPGTCRWLVIIAGGAGSLVWCRFAHTEGEGGYALGKARSPLLPLDQQGLPGHPSFGRKAAGRLIS